MTKYKWDTAHGGRRCGHTYCTACATRRGSNRGNRRVRHGVKAALRKLLSR